MDRRRLTHALASDELPAYALGALDADESAALVEHLAECPFCQADQHRLDELVGLLGTAVPQTSPPPSLREQVLAQAAIEANAGPTGERPTLRLLPGWARAALAAAAALVLILTGAVAVLLYNQWQIRQELDTLRAEQREIASILAQSAWWAPVTAEASQSQPVVGRLYLEEGQAGVLVIDGLSPLGPGQVYQIWLIRADNTRVSAGVFTVDASRRATVLLHAPGTWSAYQGMGITVEPGPAGSPGPTGPRVAGCSLADWQPGGL
ncbi:anti-sigma factor [Thermomicrobiaceae bacterium CFH 74404]|uniref:Regulator of SigK n=1 Tax=Thermalbibacter longus TaxID=2951981 RepID=A0AA41WID3_9BACT|nr:anti-sigma factor [Thermalbibacter longus]MCM8750605.1 anti-sigma factor [Thermalbibacter longus]